MSVKPVDFQISVPRTIDAAKVVESEHNKVLVHKQNETISIQQEVDRTLKQVQKKGIAEKVKVKEKQEKEKGRDNKNKYPNKKGDIENPVKKTVEADRISHFDVKI